MIRFPEKIAEFSKFQLWTFSGVTVVFIFLFGGFTIADQTSDNQDAFLPYSQIIPGSSEAIEMKPVQGGAFLMGSPEDEPGRSEVEGPQREVYVDSFWMGTYEISWDQYDLFANEAIENLKQQLSETEKNFYASADAISTPTPPYVDMSFGMGKNGFPAISMTHYAAVMFTRWLTVKTGHFYRLPTEAEWEYACRAGANSADHLSGNPEELGRYAWYDQNSNRAYKKVGTKEPNKFGLHDMLGNVAEWTMDQYYEDYFERLVDDGNNISRSPLFLPTQLYPRSVRGGSWQDGPESQRCTQRRGSRPQWKTLDPQLPKSRWWHTSAPFVGFRVVRPKEVPSREEIEKYWIEPIDDY